MEFLLLHLTINRYDYNSCSLFLLCLVLSLFLIYAGLSHCCYLFSPWLISAALHFLPSTGDHTIPNALGKSPELSKYEDEIFVNESPLEKAQLGVGHTFGMPSKNKDGRTMHWEQRHDTQEFQDVSPLSRLRTPLRVHRDPEMVSPIHAGCKENSQTGLGKNRFEDDEEKKEWWQGSLQCS